MIRQSVISSSIASIGYSKEERILEIEFNVGSIYQYLNVPESVYVGIMSAPSHGTYLNEHIKNIYKFRKVQ